MKKNVLILLLVINSLLILFIIYKLTSSLNISNLNILKSKNKISSKDNEKITLDGSANKKNSPRTLNNMPLPPALPNIKPNPTLKPSPTPKPSPIPEPTPEKPNLPVAAKPVIYFYPEKRLEVSVGLDFSCTLDITYPQIRNGFWNITAYPDGRIVNKEDGREYSYLFWEGSKCDVNYDLSTGFVVKGSETGEFLQNKLAEIGLTAKEYNEFIVYWLPLMQNNKYNLIHFEGEKYEDSAKLNITPKPDSILRVFMVYKALENPVEVETQEFKPFVRNGFTVVEWGGTEIE